MYASRNRKDSVLRVGAALLVPLLLRFSYWFIHGTGSRAPPGKWPWRQTGRTLWRILIAVLR
jgi:hypothetical protein